MRGYACYLLFFAFLRIQYAAAQPPPSLVPAPAPIAVAAADEPHLDTSDNADSAATTTTYISDSAAPQPHVVVGNAPQGSANGNAPILADPSRPNIPPPNHSIIPAEPGRLPNDGHHHDDGNGRHPHHRPPHDDDDEDRRRRRSTIGLVFGILAGVAGLLMLFFLGRCYLSYRRTPPRDRIAGLLERHALDREMEEIERQDAERRGREFAASQGRPWQAPPPPYQPPPPSYHDPSESGHSEDTVPSETKEGLGESETSAAPQAQAVETAPTRDVAR